MATDSDDTSKEDKVIKKCPICHGGLIEFEGDFVDAWGECNNSKSHKYDGFTVTKLEPFTVNHEQEPLYSYVLDMEIPANLRNGGLNFYLRGDSDDEQLVDALVNAIEGAKEMLDDGYADAVKQWSIDWDGGEQIDDGITEYILEDNDFTSK